MISKEIYQLKVTLLDSKPPIWRRLWVVKTITLVDLHYIIQAAMGWTDSHLHQFIIGNTYYSTPSEDDWMPVVDESQVTLGELVTEEGSKFVYEYDFGDDWVHTILVEKIMPRDANQPYPYCVKGKRACPPEDVGGIWGYAEFVEAIKDPHHEEHANYLQWWGGEFDPEEFDLDETNERLQKLQ
ncbi:MAG TPA: plasmid pRiA4b ORF-3 family protein [Anaerolineales bacterium]|nr:plasmid pRiA4b ORF-3 family protein [Anaerolineales bacterium]